VIDGDTLSEIHGERLRLHGIDALESPHICMKNGQAWRCGQQAAFTLDKLGRGETVDYQAAVDEDAALRHYTFEVGDLARALSPM
jgi:endonuclease YncB( thermonuclease family)